MLQVPQASFQFVQAGERVGTLVKQPVSLRGRPQSTAGTLEETHANFFFEVSDQAADSWLRDIHTLGGTDGGARNHERVEGTQLSEVQPVDHIRMPFRHSHIRTFDWCT
jgi:hypothetical protein